MDILDLRENRFWRELIRVLHKDSDSVTVVIPAFDPKIELFFRKDKFHPDDWEKLRVGRFFANVNSDCHYKDLLVIKEVENSSSKISKTNDEDLFDKGREDFTSVELIEEILRLRKAILEHHAASSGHGMCWQNDEILWQSINPELKYPHNTTPCSEEMLAQCKVYVESRLNGLPYKEPEVKIHAITISEKNKQNGK